MDEKEVKIIFGKGMNGRGQGINAAQAMWPSLIGRIKSGALSANSLESEIPILPPSSGGAIAAKIKMAWRRTKKLFIHLNAGKAVKMKLMFCNHKKFFEVEIKIDLASGRVIGFKELGCA